MENIQSAYINVPDNLNKQKRIKVLVLVLAFFLVGYLLYAFLNQIKESPISNQLPAGYHFQVIAKDKYPDGFSASLFVKKGDREWQRGEETITGSGEKLKIVEFVYKKAEPAILFPLFEKNFLNEGWVLVDNQNPALSSVRFFDKGQEEAVLTIIKINETDSLANITITLK